MDTKPSFQVVGETLLAAGRDGLTTPEMSAKTGLSASQVSKVVGKFEAATVVYSLGERDGHAIWCIVAGTDVTTAPRPVRGREIHRRPKANTKAGKGGIAEAIWHRFLDLGSSGAIADEIIMWAKRNSRWSHINYTTITARCNALKYSGLIVPHPDGAMRLTRNDRQAEVFVGVEGDFRKLYREPPPKTQADEHPIVPLGPDTRRRPAKAAIAVVDAAKAWVDAHNSGGDSTKALEALLAAAWTAFGTGAQPSAPNGERASNGAGEHSDAVLGG